MYYAPLIPHFGAPFMASSGVVFICACITLLAGISLFMPGLPCLGVSGQSESRMGLMSIGFFAAGRIEWRVSMPELRVFLLLPLVSTAALRICVKETTLREVIAG